MTDEKPTDAELIANYTRLRSEPGGAAILEVGIITWLSPYDPDTEWQPFRTWPMPPTPVDVAAAQAAALANRKLFRYCCVCRERCNAGHMHNANICQGCAEQTRGIVH